MVVCGTKFAHAIIDMIIHKVTHYTFINICLFRKKKKKKIRLRVEKYMHIPLEMYGTLGGIKTDKIIYHL